MNCKLKSIKIVGFKEPSRKIQLNFSAEPVTVIYGENGSGKTTLLKVIHAILNKDGDYLISESIKEIDLLYELPYGNEKRLVIKAIKNKMVWGENIKDIVKQTSILFGVNRGLVQNSLNSKFSAKKLDYADYINYINDDYNWNMRLSSPYEIRHIIPKLRKEEVVVDNQDDFSGGNWYKKNHLSVDMININAVRDAIVRQFKSGQQATSDKIKNAFFNTISNAVDIELEKGGYEFSNNFEQRISDKKLELIPLVEKLDKSSLQSKLLGFLSGEKNTDIINSKIFRVMLTDMLEKVEEENIDLKSVVELIKIFNGHLYGSKKVVVNENDAYIEISKGKRHGLDKLSSGERHLLTFLTLFLIIGRDRNFFIIDEPEISLNMKWQRELMPLLSELSPNSQIIVATHSPSIAHKNSNYLVELL